MAAPPSSGIRRFFLITGGLLLFILAFITAALHAVWLAIFNAGMAGLLLGLAIKHKKEEPPESANEADPTAALRAQFAAERRAFQEKIKDIEASANQTKNNFLANISHELRTPLNGVVAMTRLLHDAALSPADHEYAEIAYHSGELLMCLINDILDFIQIQQGKLEIKNTPFALRETLEDIFCVFAADAAEKEIELICDIHPDIPEIVIGDAERMRQIFATLIGNAVKFTDQGHVLLSVWNVSSPQPDEQRLHFEITDTGIGIPEEKQATLFDVFTIGDMSPTRRHGGAGLGLPISHLLVKHMGGELKVNTYPGKGSSFFFTLPLRPAPRQPETPPPMPPSCRVLLAGFPPLQEQSIIRHLERWNLTLYTVQAVEEAAQEIKNERDAGRPIQTVLLNKKQPPEPLCKLSKKIQQAAGSNPINLIVCSTINQQAELASMVKEKCISHYLIKPLRSRVLRQLLAPDTAGTPAAEPSQQTGALSSEQRKSCRILIAEDNIVNRKVALSVLARLGFPADAVQDGKEAVKALSNQDYQAVLMDAEMPVMDGFEATRIIRDPQSSVRDHQIPIIAMTAHAMKSFRDRCAAAGMNAYIAKPFRQETLFSTLSSQLQPYLSPEKSPSPPEPQARPHPSVQSPTPPTTATSSSQDSPSDEDWWLFERKFFHDAANFGVQLRGLAMLAEPDDPAEMQEFRDAVEQIGENLVRLLRLKRQIAAARHQDLDLEPVTIQTRELWQQGTAIVLANEAAAGRDITIAPETEAISFTHDLNLLREIAAGLLGTLAALPADRAPIQVGAQATEHGIELYAQLQAPLPESALQELEKPGFGPVGGMLNPFAIRFLGRTALPATLRLQPAEKTCRLSLILPPEQPT